MPPGLCLDAALLGTWRVCVGSDTLFPTEDVGSAGQAGNAEAAAPHSPTSKAHGVQSLHILPNTGYFLLTAILTGAKRHASSL